jgi:predicted RNA-binding protein associated with RNAse of E/G family
MSEGQRFKTGQAIVLRQFWQGRIWIARPFIVIQDTPQLMAFYMPTGTVTKSGKSVAKNIKPTEMLRTGWDLHDDIWTGHGRIRLTIPGQKYSVLLFWNNDGSLNRWYINLEDPLVRTRLGFDYTDQVLDVILTPDLTSWRWDDEDELAEAVAAGLLSPEKAKSLYADGRSAIELLQSGKSVFNHWVNWRPDPPWPVPVLPAGWDQL